MGSGNRSGVAVAPGSWLVGSTQGVFHGRPGGSWELLGGLDRHAGCVRRSGEAVVVGGDGGLWVLTPGAERWRQLHDETLTLVQDVVCRTGDVSAWRVASGYGIHRAAAGAHGAWRWHNHREHLPDPSARYTLRLLCLDTEGILWLAGTEAGLWVSRDGGSSWQVTALTDVAVRAMARGADGVWAGADDGAVWFSADGCSWAAGAGPGAPVLALMEDVEGRLWAGTSQGLRVRHGAGGWRPCGPPLCVACVAAAEGVLAVGGSPGGLWWSADGGGRWRSTPALSFPVLHIEAP